MNKNPIVQKYGLMIGVVACVLSIAGYLTGKDSIFGIINFIMIPVGIILACIEYSKSENYNVNFGQVFQIGFFTGLVVLTIIVVYVIVFNLIFPEMKEETISKMQEAYANNPGINDEQSSSIMDLYQNHYLAMVLAMQVTIGLVGTIVSALLGAAFAKKEPQDI